MLASFEGWDKHDWRNLVVSAETACGSGASIADLEKAVDALPDSRPGCGSRAHDHATAKIDYILANRKMLERNRFHHTSVITTLQADGASDHYPMEATFMA